MNDGLDAADFDPGLWAPGVDYVGGWREARKAADRLNRALLGAGLELSQMRAVADTTADGRALVRLAGWPDAITRLAIRLESEGKDSGGAA